MIFLRECVNAPHVLTLEDGTVLRIGPRENSEPFEVSLISNEVRFAERMGIVSIVKAPIAQTPPPVVVQAAPEPEPEPYVAPEVVTPEPPKPTTPHLKRGSGKK